MNQSHLSKITEQVNKCWGSQSTEVTNFRQSPELQTPRHHVYFWWAPEQCRKPKWCKEATTDPRSVKTRLIHDSFFGIWWISLGVCKENYICLTGLCKELNKWDSDVGLFSRVGFGPLAPVKGSLNTSACQDILDNFMLLTLWNPFVDAPVYKEATERYGWVWCGQIGLACTESWPQSD